MTYTFLPLYYHKGIQLLQRVKRGFVTFEKKSTKIYSVAGVCPRNTALITFCSPHYTISDAWLIGNEQVPRLGEDLTVLHGGLT